MKPILEVKNIWKSYLIGAKQERYLSLRDSLVGFLKTGWQRKEMFWALQDLSFEVYPGDTLGIIGRNGAGKSTLLKILSRITPPTKGSITVRGRLASLLEVGTGFHPELTGRENIFLNGAILGLKRQEIKRQFDAIVDFSGVEQFLETPLKHFSSGMQLRLAFAVAAHLEPEILLIDEVLAVGDAEFQKKCLGKMQEVSQSGRTVLFVSHNLSVVRTLCKNTLLIEEGKVIGFGSSGSILEQYAISGVAQELGYRNKPKESPHFVNIILKNEMVQHGDSLEIELELFSPNNTDVAIEVEIRDTLNNPLSYSSIAPMQGKLIQLKPGRNNRFSLKIMDLRMAAGDYILYFWLIIPWQVCYDFSDRPLRFTVIFSDPFNSGFDFKQSYNRGVFYQELSIMPSNE